MSDLIAYEHGFGGFRVGDMRLGLPMSSLREVVPRSPLSKLPCPSTWIAGGLTLRGFVVPVLDLNLLLNRPVETGNTDCIIMVSYDNKLLGLLASQVEALFFADPSTLNPVVSSDEVSQIFAGSLQNRGEGKVVNILSPQGLFNLPGLTVIADPEPHRQNLEQMTEDDEAQEMRLTSWMLLMSHGLGFAINPQDIETTVANPKLLPCELAGGFYKGNLDYRGLTIPAVDLAEALGLARAHHSTGLSQAFVVRFAEGPMAFLIDRVIDIVHARSDHTRPLPRVGLKKENLLLGALCTKDLELNSLHADQQVSQYMVLNMSGLHHESTLLELAKLLATSNRENQRAPQHGDETSGTQRSSSQPDRLIVYSLQHTFATPIDQICEVLSYQPSIEMFERSNPLLGFITHRDQTIAVIDLSQWLGEERQHLDSESSILVIETDSGLMGFAVSALRSIEHARWEPTVPVLGQNRKTVNGHLKNNQHLAELTLDNTLQMVEVICLKTECERFMAQFDSAELEMFTETPPPAIEPASCS